MKPAILLDLAERLETPRLLLRRPCPGDGRLVYAAVRETLDQLRRWPASLPWALEEPSPDVSEAYCRQAYADFAARRQLPLLMVAKNGGALIGAIGLHDIKWFVPSFELGYWCRRSCQGQGYSAEAARAVVRWAFEELGAQRLTCLCDEANGASRRVAETAGLRLEAVMRNERRTPNGELRHTCLYARTPPT